jgi:protein-arginine kinase
MKCALIAGLMLLLVGCSSRHSDIYTKKKLQTAVMEWMEKNGTAKEEFRISDIRWKDTLDLYSFTFTARIATSSGDVVRTFKHNLTTNDFQLISIDGISVEEWEAKYQKDRYGH